MSKTDQQMKIFVRLIFVAFAAPYVFVVCASVMPAGFIILIPFVAVGIWSEWPRVRNFRDARKFRRELDQGLPSSEDRSRL